MSLAVPALDQTDDAPDLLSPKAIEAITRAETDISIATAKRFPRSISRFLTDAKAMVAADRTLAESCTYRLPERIDANGKKTTPMGPSVRLAEMLAVCWGNLKVAARIVDDDGRFVTAQGVAHDLERNVLYSMEVKRRVTNRAGRRYSDDMVGVTMNAACAIVTRNVTFKVVPRAFVLAIEDFAKQIARGSVQELPARIKKAVAHFVSLGISETRLLHSLGLTGLADATFDHLDALNGYVVALREDFTTLEELFPEPAPPPPSDAPAPRPEASTKAAELAAKLKASGSGSKKKASTVQPQTLGWVHGEDNVTPPPTPPPSPEPEPKPEPEATPDLDPPGEAPIDPNEAGSRG